MTHLRKLPSIALVLASVLTSGCQDPLFEPGEDEGSDSSDAEPELETRWPEPAPCDIDPENPTALLITTTDFATGALSVLDLASGTMDQDVALASTDAIPFGYGGQPAVLNRFGFDYLDMLDPHSRWSSLSQHALSASDAASANPRGLAFGPDGLAYVSLFASADLVVLDPDQPPASAEVGRIDLSAFADDDGRPETDLLVRCGDTVWAGVQRLDVPGGFARVDVDTLVAIDIPTGAPLDLDAETPGAQGIELQGAWLKQLRRAPGSDGRVLWALTTGIERIDLTTGMVDWVVPPSAFEAAGVSYFELPLAFDVGTRPDAQAPSIYLLAYGPGPDVDVDCGVDRGRCFERARLFTIDLGEDAGDAQAQLVPFDDSMQAVERTLELVDQTLWVGSTQTDAPGLYAFDVSVRPPVKIAGPLSTGLPPFSLTTYAPR